MKERIEPESLRKLLSANRAYAADRSESRALRVVKAFKAHDRETYNLWISDHDISLINDAHKQVEK